MAEGRGTGEENSEGEEAEKELVCKTNSTSVSGKMTPVLCMTCQIS